jgi:glycine/D-amino acid oxidase-like deaminating enzyme
MSQLPVAVIGAGLQSWAAAAHLVELGIEPVVLEAGDGPATPQTLSPSLMGNPTTT